MFRETNRTPTSLSVKDREFLNLMEGRRLSPSFIFASDRANRLCGPIVVHMYGKIKVEPYLICFLLSTRRPEEMAKGRVNLRSSLPNKNRRDALSF